MQAGWSSFLQAAPRARSSFSFSASPFFLSCTHSCAAWPCACLGAPGIFSHHLVNDKPLLSLARKYFPMIKKSSAIPAAGSACAREAGSTIDHVSKTPPEAVLDGFSGTAEGFMAAAQSEATKRAYASDLRHFLNYGGARRCCTNRVSDGMTPTPDESMPPRLPAR